ncbi:hypothetical protein JCM10207_007219 [Rhodosporidiobolus poonsookiae]
MTASHRPPDAPTLSNDHADPPDPLEHPLLPLAHPPAPPPPLQHSSSFEESDSRSGDKDGNETDVEDEGEGGSGSLEMMDSEALVPVQAPGEAGRAMYPFGGHDPDRIRRRRGSSAFAEASSAATSSEGDSSDDDEGGIEPMEGVEGGAASPQGRRKRPRIAAAAAAVGAPPRLRRVGALGISVHSDSDPEAPNVSGLDSSDLRCEGGESTDTRATDLGISTSQLREPTTTTSSGEGRPKKKRRKRIGDATFRGIVDELSVQNAALRGRLTRYEARGIPAELKDDRLFEIRFGPALPSNKRAELEGYLRRYVQDLAAHPDKSAPRPSQPRPVPLPPLPAAGSKFQHDNMQDIDPAIAPFYLAQQGLAGPSNSGFEPASFSGTGHGMVMPHRHGHSFPSAPVSAIETPAVQATAREVVAALEDLFYHSLLRTAASRSPLPAASRSPLPAESALPPNLALPAAPSSPQCPSNETYFSHLLSHDFLSQGYVYLNLACTMAQVHRFSVTLEFVQRAVRQFSTRLEVSDDGRMIRWIGPKTADELRLEMGDPAPVEVQPEPAKKASSRGTGKRVSTVPPQATPSEASGTSAQPSSLSRVSSGSRNPSSGSGSSSRDPSSGENVFGESVAAPSTAATSQPSSGQDSQPGNGAGGPRKKGSPPVRPTAAVLQPLDRLRQGGAEDHKPSGEADAAGDKAGSASTVNAVVGSVESVHPKQADARSVASGRRSSSRRHNTLFDRLRRNRSPSPADEEDDATAPPSSIIAGNAPYARERARAEKRDGAGGLVFYANSDFCSDLSKNAEPHDGHVVVKGLPTPIEEELALGAEKTVQRRPSLEESDSSGMVASRDSGSVEVEMDDDELLEVDEGELKTVDRSASGSGSGGSGASSLERLKTSGMTSTVPADLFTLVVRTRHLASTDAPPPKDLSSSFALTTEYDTTTRTDAYAPTRPPLKKARLASSEVVSTKAIYHSATTTKRDPFEVGVLSGSGSSSLESRSAESGGNSSEEERKAYGAAHHLLTASNLLRHASGGVPLPFAALPTPPDLVPLPTHLVSTTPSPSHDDYLLSLSAPSHAWAPPEPGLHSGSKAGSLASVAQSFSGLPDGEKGGKSLGLVGLPVQDAASTTGTMTGKSISTGDERPISLDDWVGQTREQVKRQQRRVEQAQTQQQAGQQGP